MFNICLDAHRPPSCNSVRRSLLLLEKLKSPPLSLKVLVPNARDHEAPDARPAAWAWARTSKLKTLRGFSSSWLKQSVISPFFSKKTLHTLSSISIYVQKQLGRALLETQQRLMTWGLHSQAGRPRIDHWHFHTLGTQLVSLLRFVLHLVLSSCAFTTVALKKMKRRRSRIRGSFLPWRRFLHPFSQAQTYPNTTSPTVRPGRGTTPWCMHLGISYR